MQQYSGAAVATLFQLMTSPNPAAVRLQAASKVLDLALRATEIEDLREWLDPLVAREAISDAAEL